MKRTIIPQLLLGVFVAMTGLSGRGAEEPVSDAKDAVRLSPGDKLVFSIREDPRAGKDYVIVKPQGQIAFPVSSGSEVMVTIESTGKTLGDIKRELKAALDRDYYYDSQIRLDIEDRTQRMAQIIFSGQVKRSTYSFDLANPKTLYEALADVGYSEWANLKKVRVDRHDPVTKSNRIIEVDVDAVKKGNREKDIVLRDGDRIDVPEVRFRLLP